MDPIWVRWVFSMVCLCVAGYYAVTLVSRNGEPGAGAARSAGIGYRLSHLGMALGMAAMFSPVGDPVPRLLWVAVYGVAAAWFGSRVLRTGWSWTTATAHHLVANLAMLFMLTTAHHPGTAASADAAGHPGATGHEGHAGAAGAGWSTGSLVTVLTVLLVGYFVLHIGRSLRALFAAPTPTAPRPVRCERQQSRLAVGCHVVLGTAMAVMLGLMLSP